MKWLRYWADIWDPLPPVVAPTPVCEAEWQALVDATRINAYQHGLAQGELRGRLLLANEIEQEFGLHAGQEQMTAVDAARIKARQLH